MTSSKRAGRHLAAGAVGVLMVTAAIVLAAAWPASAADPAAQAAAGGFNRAGDMLIADQFNNRVIEVDAHHRIVWQFGRGPHDFTAASIIGVNDAQRVGPLTLMAGTGTPANTIPECPQGCPDNRVVLVTPSGRIVWQYGTFGVTGSGPDQLNTPVQSTWLPDVHVLITDQGNQRVIEVHRQQQIVWQYPAQPDQALLDGAAFASRLPDGHTLITDANNNRVIEIDRAGTVVWSYVTNTQPGSNPDPLPTRAVRLADGHTLISDQFNDRVIEVNRSGDIVRQEGNLNSSGYSTTTTAAGLYAPYDAKVIGDYTGLTPPLGVAPER